MLVAPANRGGRFGEPRLQCMARATDREGPGARAVSLEAVEQCAIRHRAAEERLSRWPARGREDCGFCMRVDLLLGSLCAACGRDTACAVVLGAMPCDAGVRLDLQHWLFQLLPFAWSRFLRDCAFLAGAAVRLRCGACSQRAGAGCTSAGIRMASGLRGLCGALAHFAGMDKAAAACNLHECNSSGASLSLASLRELRSLGFFRPGRLSWQ